MKLTIQIPSSTSLVPRRWPARTVGTPLSERMAGVRPRSRKSCSKAVTGEVLAGQFERLAHQNQARGVVGDGEGRPPALTGHRPGPRRDTHAKGRDPRKR